MTDPLKRQLEILALITAILFVLATPVAFTVYSLERSVFDANLYIQAMDEENIYQQLPLSMAQTFVQASQRPGSGNLLSIFRNLSVEQWQGLIVQILPPHVLRVLMVDSVTQVMGFLNGERSDAIVSLAILKTHLQSPEGSNAINLLLEAQPDCTVEQLTSMALNPQTFALCNPPDTFLLFDLRPIIAAQVSNLVTLIPEQVTLIPEGSSRPAYLDYVNDFRVFMRLSPMLPILCLLIIAILVVRTWRGWLSWWGYPLLIAGFLSLFISVISAPLSSLIFQVLFVPALPAFIPADMLEMFRGLMTTIVRHALQPALLFAGGMILVGLVMVALGFFLRKRIERTPLYS